MSLKISLSYYSLEFNPKLPNFPTRTYSNLLTNFRNFGVVLMESLLHSTIISQVLVWTTSRIYNKPSSHKTLTLQKIMFFRYIYLFYIVSDGHFLTLYLFFTKYTILGWIHTTVYIIVIKAAICCLIIHIKLYEASEDISSSYNALIELKDLFLQGI